MTMISPSSFGNNVKNRVSSPVIQPNGNPRKFKAKVAENNKLTDGFALKVYPSELLPLNTFGELRDNPIGIKRQFLDANYRTHVAKGTHGSTITAIWYTTDNYRKTAPQVQRDEHVLIWQEGDTGIWRWEELTTESTSHRRRETIVHGINAEPPEHIPDKGYNDSRNMYYTEMSSHNKSYTISTSKANKEVAAYRFQINGEKGAINLQDDTGNYIELFTIDKRIVLMNSDNTYVELIGPDIFIHCNNNRESKIDNDDTDIIGNNSHLKVGNDQTIEIGNNQATKIGGNMKLVVSGNVDIEVSGNANVKVSGTTTVESGGSMTVKAPSITFDTPDATFTGNVNIQGSLGVSGASSLGGGGSVTGNLDVSGKVALNGGTSNGRIHGS